ALADAAEDLPVVWRFARHRSEGRHRHVRSGDRPGTRPAARYRPPSRLRRSPPELHERVLPPPPAPGDDAGEPEEAAGTARHERTRNGAAPACCFRVSGHGWTLRGAGRPGESQTLATGNTPGRRVGRAPTRAKSSEACKRTGLP